MPVNIDEESQMPTFDSIKLIGTKKIPFILLLVVIIIIYVFLFTFLNNMSIDNDKNKWWILILEIILVIILIVVVSLNIDELKNNFSFSTNIKNLFNDRTPEIEIVAEKDDKQEEKKKCKDDDDGEVFHVFNNKYNYYQAREVCNKLDARLATYDEIETAYNKGGSWCSYGWSEDQLALFPTSKDVYNKLKKSPDHKNDCGRQGVNGGYIKDKGVKFGVNCFGKKPVMDDAEKYFMDNYTFSPTYSDSSYNKDTSCNTFDVLVAPFNKTKWNEY